MTKESIAQQLFQEGLITQEQLDLAEQIHDRNGGRHGDILLGLGAISEETFQKFLAQRHRLDYFERQALQELEPDPRLLQAIPYSVARDQLLFPVALAEEAHKNERGEAEVFRVLSLAVVGPLSKEISRQIRQLTQADKIRYILSTRDNLHTYIRFHYLKFLQRTSSGLLEKISPEDQDELVDSASYLRKEGFSLPPTSEIPQGELIAQRWQLKELLAEGGMGLIYTGWDVEQRSEVAIKVLRTQHQVDQEAVERLQREAHILERLQHPHLIRVYHSGFEEGKGFYIVMELLKGCSLDVLIKRSKDGLSLQAIEQISTAVCEAMDFAHKKGVIHRDLKPENIYIVGGPEQIRDIKVLDFGIAKLIESRRSSALTQTGMTLGTPRYLSPEQATGTYVDQRTDIYSLSVILFEALTGQELFQADSPYQYLMKHVYTIPRNLHETVPTKAFPLELNTVLHQGLAKRPADRPNSMGDLLSRLLQAFRSPPVIGIQQTGATQTSGPMQAGRYRVTNTRGESVHSAPARENQRLSVSSPKERVLPAETKQPHRDFSAPPRALSYEELPKVSPSRSPAMGSPLRQRPEPAVVPQAPAVLHRPRQANPPPLETPSSARQRPSHSSSEVLRLGKASVELPRVGRTTSSSAPAFETPSVLDDREAAYHGNPRVGAVSVELPRIGAARSRPPEEPVTMPSLLHRPPRTRGLSIEELPSVRQGQRTTTTRPASVVPMAPIKNTEEIRTTEADVSTNLSALPESVHAPVEKRSMWIALSMGAFFAFLFFLFAFFYLR